MKRLLLTIQILIISNALWADEGMWLPYAMNPQVIEQMKARGLNLPFEAIYDEKKISIKDAIVSLDEGSCTAEFVSSAGLLLTNHHCGFDAIQSHSTPAHDYLTNGFWAASLAEELPCPGMTASILVASHDVTQRALDALRDKLDRRARQTCLDSLSQVLTGELIQNKNLAGEVISFFEDNLFLFLVQETFTDIRLVGTPPSSIGKFGGDTDNWMWPRHTGDFCFFRVYSAPNQTPADYSKENIPYHPRKHLTINTNGVAQGDFAMVLGYPGSTSRYATTGEIRQTQNITNPIIAEARGIRQAIWQQSMNANSELNIKYASKHAASSNYWKYAIGQNEGLRKGNLMEIREREEDDLIRWSKEDSSRQTVAGSMAALSASYVVLEPLVRVTTLYDETVLSGPDLTLFAFQLMDLVLRMEEQQTQTEAYQTLQKEADDLMHEFYRDFDLSTDQKVMQAMLAYLLTKAPAEFLPKRRTLMGKRYINNITGYVDHLYANSLLTDSARLRKFIHQPVVPMKKILKDPMMAFMRQMIVYYFDILSVVDQFEEQIDRNKQVVMEALMQKEARPFYPDANSTLRISYGTVQDYSPSDGILYKWQTTLKGIAEKAQEGDNNSDYRLTPQQQAQLQQTLSNGNNLPVCFITTNDITGGNSGSPVLDANGELIGLAFDGNWEAMTSDITYDEAMQRCICVDIRYILFVMRQSGSADRLMEELL